MTNNNAPDMSYTSPQGQNTSHSKSTGIIIATLSILLVAAVIIVALLLVKNSRTADSAPTQTQSSTPNTTFTPLDLAERAQAGISLGKDLVAGTENEGAVQVDIYFDYACGHCNRLGNEYGAGLGEAAKAGNITLVYHPVAIMNTLFSYIGAGAELFVADNDPSKYFQFHELLHEKLMTPYMNGEIDNPGAQDIIAVAKEAGVSEKNCEALLKELTDMEDILLNENSSSSTSLLTRIVESSNQFVEESMQATGSAGTPTVYIDNVKSTKWTNDIANLLAK